MNGLNMNSVSRYVADNRFRSVSWCWQSEDNSDQAEM